MAKKGGKTQTVTVDPKSQGYIDQMRYAGRTGANDIMNHEGSFFTGPLTATPGEMAAPWMNAYQDQVIGGIRGEYDHLRGLASRDAKSAATLQGAYGGDRAALMEGARLGAVDRAEASQVGDLMYRGYGDAMDRGTNWAQYNQQLEQQRLQEPLWRRQQQMGLYNLGLGPTGTSTTQPGGSWLGTAAGGAMTALGAGLTGGTSLALGAGLGAAQGLWG